MWDYPPVQSCTPPASVHQVNIIQKSISHISAPAIRMCVQPTAVMVVLGRVSGSSGSFVDTCHGQQLVWLRQMTSDRKTSGCRGRGVVVVVSGCVSGGKSCQCGARHRGRCTSAVINNSEVIPHNLPQILTPPLVLLSCSDHNWICCHVHSSRVLNQTSHHLNSPRPATTGRLDISLHHLWGTSLLTY